MFLMVSRLQYAFVDLGISVGYAESTRAADKISGKPTQRTWSAM